ncbi:MAG: hypothetical protein HeimC3_05000 [Candidatus Heimdallarchaeota archaeon LC_3]|nr:MAG: hypothetical protein HeimC3_05000 [Candidatus Heimdallarchaeota archaeon LC_3]
MGLEFRKPLEPVYILIGAFVVILISLNINYLSISIFGFSLIGFKGLEIVEALFFFGLSSLVALVASIIYYLGKSKSMLLLSRNLTIIGLIPGLFGTLLFLLGINSGKSLLEKELGTSEGSNLLSIDIGLGVGVIGLLMMGLAVYMMSTSIPASLGLTKEATLTPNIITKINKDTKDPVQELKKLWYCSKDNFKLTANASREVPSPEFSISRERITAGLNNAMAMRKISPDVMSYAESLVEQLFLTTEELEIELVSTICTQCKTRYLSPKLTKWSFK